jgi:hypothetical protein
MLKWLKLTGFCLLIVVLAGVGFMTFAQTEKLPQNEQEARALVASRAQAIDAVRAESLVLLEGMKSSRDTIAGESWRSRTPYRPPKINSYEDLNFNDPLVHFEKMTKQEQLLIWGYPATLGAEGGGSTIPFNLAIDTYAQYHYFGRTTPDLLRPLNGPVWSMDFLKKYLAMLISPLTGKLIEVDHEEFSPGNAYIRVVSPDEVKKLIALDPTVDEWWRYAITAASQDKALGDKNIGITLTGREVSLDRDPGGIWAGFTHEPYVVYMRIYGEKGVLAEGLF